MKCSIIIVTYNAKDYTKVCLERLASGMDENRNVEVILFDNDSKDGVKDVLREYEGCKNFIVDLNPKNIGFASGNNEAAKIAHGEYIFLLNPDTEIDIDEVEKLTLYLDAHPDVGVVGPKIFDSYGAVQESYGESMTAMSELLGKIFGSKYVYKLPVVRQVRTHFYDKEVPTDVGWIGGAALMIRKKLFEEIKGIDQNFFYSAGDMVDLCASVKEKGFRVVFYPDATMLHRGGGANVTDKTESLRRSFEGSLYFFKKHYGRFGYVKAKIVYIITSLMKGLVSGFVAIFRGGHYKAISKSHFVNVYRLMSGKL